MMVFPSLDKEGSKGWLKPSSIFIQPPPSPLLIQGGGVSDTNPCNEVLGGFAIMTVEPQTLSGL